MIIINKIIYGILNILLYPLYLLLVATRGKELSSTDLSKFVENFFIEFNLQISSFLNITTVPEIYISKEQKIGTEQYRILGKFYIKDIYTEPSKVTRLYKSSNIMNNSFITIYIINCYEAAIRNNCLTKLYLVKTIVHELTHYKQFVEGRFVNSSSASTYGQYAKKANEIEARHSSRKFCFINSYKIFMFLIRN